MTNSKKVLQNENYEGVNPIIAAITGAFIGAAVGALGAIASKNEKNRGKAREILNNIKNQTIGYLEGMKMQVRSKKNKVKD